MPGLNGKQVRARRFPSLSPSSGKSSPGVWCRRCLATAQPASLAEGDFYFPDFLFRVRFMKV